MTQTVSNNTGGAGDKTAEDFVTVTIAGQLFGLPIGRVQDVFTLADVTRVPLSLPEVAGVLNLRGRIVTAIDMRTRLGLPTSEEGQGQMAVGIEFNNESYGLIIDQIGDVLRLSCETFEVNPVNLEPCWNAVAAGVHRLKTELMIVLDVDKVLALAPEKCAAA